MSLQKTYSELISIPNFGDRYNYLKLTGKVGATTFGDDRYLNQILYHDYMWKRTRNEVISRDRGCDLAHQDFPIRERIYIHHLNPLTRDDILNRSPKIFDLENLVCVSFDTHQGIHYGTNTPLDSVPVERTPNDTCPWRK